MKSFLAFIGFHMIIFGGFTVFAFTLGQLLSGPGAHFLIRLIGIVVGAIMFFVGGYLVSNVEQSPKKTYQENTQRDDDEFYYNNMDKDYWA